MKKQTVFLEPEKIKSKEYERLDEKAKEKLKTENNIEIEDYIKHPITIKKRKKKHSLSKNVKIMSNIVSKNVIICIDFISKNVIKLLQEVIKWPN